jgi:hypothetical protein
VARSYERMAAVDEAHAVDWLDKAVAIHRSRMAKDPTHVVTQRELGIALVQLGQAAGAGNPQRAAEALHEAYELLRALRERGALEAQFHGAVDALAQLLTPT